MNTIGDSLSFGTILNICFKSPSFYLVPLALIRSFFGGGGSCGGRGERLGDELRLEGLDHLHTWLQFN